jgi:predicted DNA-binding transcriptional regulator AlpA
MVMDIDGDEIVDAPEIADRLGLKSSRQVLDLRCHRLGFPEPVGRQGRKLIWSWSQVESWAAMSLSSLTATYFAPVG